MEEPEWMSPAEVARYLGLIPRTVYALIDRGELPAYSFGRVLRLRRADVFDYIEQSRIQPGDLRHLYPAGPDNEPDEPSS